MLTVWGDGYVNLLDCGDSFTTYVYIKTWPCIINMYNFYLSISPHWRWGGGGRINEKASHSHAVLALITKKKESSLFWMIYFNAALKATKYETICESLVLVG